VIEVPPTVEDMIPLARKIVREEMKKEVMQHQIREREKHA